jgi:hypothetical protein
VNSSGEATIYLRAGSDSLQVTKHAALRLTQRGISIDKEFFINFAAQNDIGIETPVNRKPGMTETAIPVGAVGEFNDMALFAIEGEGG